ncbi:MAG: glycosyltransferase family 39 protein [Candidatus Gottesmanbacteria bacterium]|nr:glycosyltransferase family 39 protein [Candidatus Gottesmanbacteria bacterium]
MSVAQRWAISLLCFITAVGFFVRIYHVDTNPAGFFCDEASIGYNAYTLLTTGKDEHGTSLPVFFRSFGDYRTPIPFYTAIPFIALFGLSELSVRLATVSVGTLTIVVLFLFIHRLFVVINKERYAALAGLVGAGILAISPWHIHFSRFGSEYIYLPFFLLFAAWCFLESIHHRKMFILASVLSIAICYTYLPGVILGPLFYVGSFFIILPYGKNSKHTVWLGIIIALLTFTPVLIAWQNKTLQTRWNNVELEKTQPVASQIQLFVSQYISHFSPLFLFTKGDTEYPGHYMQRFGVRGQGQIYLVDGIFVLLGIVFCILSMKRYPVMLFPLLILFLYPIGSSITKTDGGPFSFRSILGSIAFPIVSTIGITLVFSLIRNKRVQLVLSLLIFLGYGISFGRYLYLYHTQYPLYSQDFAGWQFGPRDVMKTFLDNKGKYDEYLLIGEFNAPEIFLKFYDPTNICQNKCRIAGVNDIHEDRSQLIAISPQSWQQVPNLMLTVQKVIPYPNGQPAYYIATSR